MVEDIKNNVVSLKDSRFAKVGKITAKDISLLTQNERNNIIYSLATIVRALSFDFDIVKIEQPYNFNPQYQHLINISNKGGVQQENNSSVEEQLLNYAEHLNQIKKKFIGKKRFII